MLLILAGLCIGRGAVSQNMNYINLKKYSALQESPPFQNRILMAPVLHAAANSPLFLYFYRPFFQKTVESPEDLVVTVTDCLCVVMMLFLTMTLREAFSPNPRTTWLSPLIMLVVVAFTYVVRYEQRFTMPYDFFSMLLFNIGLLGIVNRRGWLLLATLAIALPNRETAIFLIPIWMGLEWREGRRVGALAYGIAGLVISLAWRIEIARLIHQSRVLYSYPWHNNLISVINPVHWPQLFSVFGFLAIPMWMLRGRAKDLRLRALWISTVPFIAAALLVGVWRETRIFGELSAIVGVTFGLQLEDVLGYAGAPRV